MFRNPTFTLWFNEESMIIIEIFIHEKDHKYPKLAIINE